MENDPFLFRTMSSFPLSIGTGLMLETLFNSTSPRYDEKREIPKRINVDNYKYHIYNIGTLMRNILSAAGQKPTEENLASINFKNSLISEIMTIKELYSNTKCTPIIFMPDYTAVYKALNNAKLSEATKEILNTELMFKSIAKLDIRNLISVVTDGYRIPNLTGEILITTSYPVDLLNHNNMTLLESHTGKLKQKWEWYSKYHKIGTKDMSVFPFMELLLYYLGDGTMVTPAGLAIRSELHALAVEHNWTSRTSRDKIIADIYKKPALKEMFTKYKKIY